VGPSFPQGGGGITEKGSEAADQKPGACGGGRRMGGLKGVEGGKRGGQQRGRAVVVEAERVWGGRSARGWRGEN